MNFAWSLLPIALFGACRATSPSQAHKSTPVTPVKSTPVTPVSTQVVQAPSEVHALTVDDTPTSFEVYTPKDAEPFEGWRLLMARKGVRVRLGLKSNSTGGSPVELEGSITNETPRVKFEALARTSKHGILKLSGIIESSGELHGTLNMQSSREHLELRRHVSPNGPEEKWEDKIGGTLDSTHRFRLEWVQSNERAVVTLSRVGEKSTKFEGTLDSQSGRFELRVPTHPEERLRGVLSGAPEGAAGIGEWLHAGRAEPIVLDHFYPTYPPDVNLPNGARVIAVEQFRHGLADCRFADDVFPRFEGIAAAPRLNHELENMIGPLGDCDIDKPVFLGSLWFGSTYSVTASSARWVGFAVDSSSYMGGAHGLYGKKCFVADTETGKVVQLNEEIAPQSFKKLSSMVRQSILQQAHGQSLVDLGFFGDDPHVNSNREMCVIRDRGALFLELVYQNSTDEAGLFQFADIRPRLAAAVARQFFLPGSIGAKVFQ